MTPHKKVMSFEEIFGKRYPEGNLGNLSYDGAREGWKAAQASQREEVEALREKCKRYAEYFDNMHGTPCEQIRHAQEVSELRALVGRLVAALETVKWNPTQSCLGEVDEALTEANKVME